MHFCFYSQLSDLTLIGKWLSFKIYDYYTVKTDGSFYPGSSSCFDPITISHFVLALFGGSLRGFKQQYFHYFKWFVSQLYSTVGSVSTHFINAHAGGAAILPVAEMKAVIFKVSMLRCNFFCLKIDQRP